MKLINQIRVDINLNAKAKAIAPFLRQYNDCLMTDEAYGQLVSQIRELLDICNSQHKRTVPFEIYGKTDNYIYITLANRPEQRVAYLCVHTVKSVFDENEGIAPAEDYEITKKNDHVEANS